MSELQDTANETLTGPSAAPPVKRAVRQRQLAAVKHGLYVRAPSGLKLRSRRVRRLAAKVWQTLPWLQPSDDPGVKGWCELELVTATMFPAVLDGTGDADLWRRLMLAKLAYERELGMTPASRAELGLTVSQGMNFTERLQMALAAKTAREAAQP